MDHARAEAEHVLSDARAEADRLVREAAEAARAERDTLRAEIADLTRQREDITKYLNDLRGVLEGHTTAPSTPAAPEWELGTRRTAAAAGRAARRPERRPKPGTPLATGGPA